VSPADHITLAGQPCVGAFPKIVLSTCPAEAVLTVSNARRQCKEATWLFGQVAWPAGLISGPYAPNLWPEPRLTPPINTTVLPSAESVTKVRISPPPHQGASKFNLCRVEREARFRTSQLVGSPWSSSSAEALPESIQDQRGFLSSSLIECGSSVEILRILTEPTLESLSCIRIMACQGTSDITSEWVIYQS
jgi:hypothetical protein